MDDFDDISEEEAVLAAKLAEALDGAAPAPEEQESELGSLLEHAAFARVSADFSLTDARRAALREEVVRTAARVHKKKEREADTGRMAPWWLIWLPLPAAGMAAGMAAVLMYSVSRDQSAPEATLASTRPGAIESEAPKIPTAASADLIEAQAIALAAQANGKNRKLAREHLDAQMRDYRRQLLAQADTSSGGKARR